MKLYYTLIFTAVIMAFVTGYFALFLQRPYESIPSDYVEVEKQKQEFKKQFVPRMVVNLNSIYYSRDHFQLMNPFYNREDKGKDVNVYESSKNCYTNISSILNSVNYEKVLIWEEFRCGDRSKLPPDYFKNPPFMHPSGKSYSYLAFKLKKRPYSSGGWVKKHLIYFHVSEFKHLKPYLADIGGVFEILSELNNDSLDSLVKGKEFVLTKKYLFSKIKHFGKVMGLEYGLYTRKDLENYIKDGPYVVKNYNKGKRCFIRDGELCWEYNVRHFLELTTTSTINFFLGSLLIISLVIFILLNKIRQQRREEQRKRLALQVLTHEFRTPIASMLLQMERVQKQFLTLNDDLQESFLRLSNDVFRLQRLTETSRNYLKIQNSEGLLEQHEDEIPSLNDYISEQIEIYIEGENGRFTPLEEDKEATFDSYWISICIKNILENAKIHGKPPISVTLKVSDNFWTVIIEDCGECPFSTFEEITSEFVKGEKSSGTGLGLNIVRKVLYDMGGELKFSKNPTKFELSIPWKARKVKTKLGKG